MDEAPILVEGKQGYRLITLNRPSRLNSFNEAMHLALRAALAEAEADTILPRRAPHRRRARLLRRAGPFRPGDGRRRRAARSRPHHRDLLLAAREAAARAADADRLRGERRGGGSRRQYRACLRHRARGRARRASSRPLRASASSPTPAALSFCPASWARPARAPWCCSPSRCRPRPPRAGGSSGNASTTTC